MRQMTTDLLNGTLEYNSWTSMGVHQINLLQLISESVYEPSPSLSLETQTFLTLVDSSFMKKTLPLQTSSYQNKQASQTCHPVGFKVKWHYC